GKHSGRTAFKQRLEELGVKVHSQSELNEAFTRFKELADKKHEIFDEDIQALMSETEAAHVTDRFSLVYMKVASETGTKPAAQVCVSVDGTEHNAEAEGGGPVDAVYGAIEKIVGSGAELLLYSVSNVTKGIDAQGEVTVRLQKGGRVV